MGKAAVTKGGPKRIGKSATETGARSTKAAAFAPARLAPHDIFKRCIQRAQNLINFHDEEWDEELCEPLCDAYRAAVVLSISALDAFVRSTVTEKINAILLDRSKPLPTDLANYLKGLLNQDKLLDAARRYDLHEAVDRHIKEDFSTKAFQGEWKIRTFMALVNHKDIFKQVSIAADISENNLIKKLDEFTKRRHVIAHSGDYDLTTTTHTENSIDKKYAQDCVDLVTKFALHMNEICGKS